LAGGFTVKARTIHGSAVAISFVSLASLASAQTTERVSVSVIGGGGGGGIARPSADGRYVVFVSYDADLVAGDTNASPDVFVRDRELNQTTRVSVTSSGGQASGVRACTSADARYIVFESVSPCVASDTNGDYDVYVHDRATATTTRVSVTTSGAQVHQDCTDPSVSGDGLHVAFASTASGFFAGDNNAARDVFVHDRASGQTICASVDPTGGPAEGESSSPSLSADGRWLAFQSSAHDLVAGGNSTGVLLRDLVAGTTTFVAGGWSPSVSADGRYAAFSSDLGNLVSGDHNESTDAFVRDMLTGTIRVASVSSSGELGNGVSRVSDVVRAAVSANGRFVAFESAAENLVGDDDNGYFDVFVHDFVSGLTERVDVSSSHVQANSFALHGALSGDGRTVVFTSPATNLVPDDVNGVFDAFARDVAFTPASYCTAAITTHGCASAMQSDGAASASASSGFTLLVASTESDKSGLFFYGLGAAAAPFAPGNSSVMCVSAPRQRTSLSSTGGVAGDDCSGTLALDWNAWRAAHPGALGSPFGAGLVLRAQGWFRDPAAAGGSNLSNALVFVLGP
jgi:Tol biopolymer transport system component